MSKTKIIDDIGLDNETTSINKVKNSEKKGDKKMDLSKKVSFKLGIVGCGQCGARLCEAFNNLGYDAVAINTATQDLVHIKLPEENKLFTDIGIQGAAKDLSRGEEAALSYKDKIQELIYSKLDSSQILVVCSSVGGGSGAGSLPTIIDVCNTTGKPIVLIAVLPKVSEDVRTKSNSLETVAKLATLVRDNKVQSFILVDNAKIESINSGIGQMDFYKIANKSIVEPIDIFNQYSMEPSEVKGLDSAEWATLLLNAGGISTYGQISIDNYEGDTAIAEALFASLQQNMLVSGLDYKQAKFVGYMLIGNSKVWSKISSGAVDYANSMVNDIFGNPEATFKGLYVDNTIADDIVKVYTFVSGLGIPEERMLGLKKDIEAQQANLKIKDVDRMNKMKVDIGKDNTVSDVDRIKARISAKLSGLGKLANLGKK
ncbi:MAG: hypothetical protein ACOYMA_00790 [Bacteroidia bacterium]